MSDQHRDWALALAYVRGRQNIDYSSKTNRWVKNPTNPWQARTISNQLLPIARNKISKFSRVKPIWDVIPATPDQEDVEISKTSTKIMEDVWVRNKVSLIYLRCIYWMVITGNGFIKVGWDADIGNEVEVNTADLEPEVLQQARAAMGFELETEIIKVREGDLRFEVPPPFNIMFDHMVPVFEDSEWIIETQIRSLDWIVEKFGNQWKDKLTESDEVEHLIHAYVHTEDVKVNRRGVLTHEFYTKKGGRFKNGLHSFSADGQFLIPPRDLPFEHGRLPYVHFKEIIDPLSPWGYSSVDQGRPQQARYNRINSGITDHINLTSKVQWLIPKRAQIEQITNKPGENIYYSGNIPPIQSQPRNIPSYVEATLERTKRDLQDTTSFHNVSQGQGEPGVRSGRAIIALQDSDESVDASTFMLVDQALIDVGRLVIETLNQHVNQERILKVRGEFNELQTLTYTGQMLRGQNNGDYFDVRIKTTGQRSMSRASRENSVIQLVDLGILDPIRDRSLILNMIDTADTAQIFDEEEADRSRQWREIQSMQQGQEVQVVFGENHEVHLKMLKKFMASSQRDKVSPEALKLIQGHAIQHLQMQAAEIVQQQQIALLAVQGGQNAPGNNGPDSGNQNGNSSGGNSNPRQGNRAAARSQNTGVNTTV